MKAVRSPGCIEGGNALTVSMVTTEILAFAWVVRRIADRLRPACAGETRTGFKGLVLQLTRPKGHWDELDRIVAYCHD